MDDLRSTNDSSPLPRIQIPFHSADFVVSSIIPNRPGTSAIFQTKKVDFVCAGFASKVSGTKQVFLRESNLFGQEVSMAFTLRSLCGAFRRLLIETRQHCFQQQ